jgi:osmotically-inducible protein OsmY
MSRLVAAVAVASLLGGCIVVVGDKDDGFEAGWASSYEEDSAARREDNDRLADLVMQKLDDVPDLASEDITVSASGEVVTLYGRLRDPEQLQQAITAARGVAGVGRVVSRITVDVRS